MLENLPRPKLFSKYRRSQIKPPPLPTPLPKLDAPVIDLNNIRHIELNIHNRLQHFNLPHLKFEQSQKPTLTYQRQISKPSLSIVKPEVKQLTKQKFSHANQSSAFSLRRMASYKHSLNKVQQKTEEQSRDSLFKNIDLMLKKKSQDTSVSKGREAEAREKRMASQVIKKVKVSVSLEERMEIQQEIKELKERQGKGEERGLTDQITKMNNLLSRNMEIMQHFIHQQEYLACLQQ